MPISKQASEKIYEYLLNYGGFRSVYDLRNIKEITAEKFEEIKPMVKISAPESLGVEFLNFYRLQKSLAVEEGPTKAAVEDWQDMLVSPKNINKVTVDDLILLQNVSLVDAIAVIKHLKAGQELKGYRDLRDISGLTNYGYLNIRSFISYTDPKPIKFSGNYRLNYEYGYDYEETSDPDMFLASINQGYEALQDITSFHNIGISDNDIEKYYTQMQEEYDYLSGLNYRTQLSQRIRARIGSNFNLGLRYSKDSNPGGLNDELQGYIQSYKIGPFKKLFLGDYRVVIGQGLLLDNSSEFISRTYSRSQGLFGDLTTASRLGFRGVGGEIEQNRFKAIGFYSKTPRDGIENPDGSIYYYIISQPRFPTYKNTFTETNYGGSARVDLSGVGIIPEGSALAFNSLMCRYDKDFSPQAKWIDLPGDATFFDDANILQLASGKKRDLYSLDFRSALDNISFEGEYAWQKDGGKAYLFQARAQYDYLYVMGLFRHYDVNYDNPYNRGFCEQLRFEDTPLEKTYRLIDPTYSLLQSFPSPKAEQGLYLETRYQISRQFTLTRAYIDIWRN
ncbi:MAG: helix-hairpin-helix domain-containing protein, partial [Ignavibacteria bacterium]|nr:helix-hairpin-helix domain-containing protein [Ignavibacteria bacterium]